MVTGAQGWLGSRVVERLSKPHKVTGLARSDVDCTDEAHLRSVLASLQPDILLHLAGSTRHRSELNAMDAHWRDGVVATKNVLEVASAARVGHVILAGSMEELGDAPGVLTLDTPAKPLTEYGLSKSIAREFSDFIARTREARIDWFRPCAVYGPGQRGNMLVPTACEAAVRGTPARFTDGRQQRDFLFVDDLLRWVELLIDLRPTATGRLNLHHLGTGRAVAVRDVLEFIASSVPTARFEIGALARRPQEPDVQIAPELSTDDPAIAVWRAEVPWEIGIKKTLDWWIGQSR